MVSDNIYFWKNAAELLSALYESTAHSKLQLLVN